MRSKHGVGRWSAWRGWRVGVRVRVRVRVWGRGEGRALVGLRARVSHRGDN